MRDNDVHPARFPLQPIVITQDEWREALQKERAIVAGLRQRIAELEAEREHDAEIAREIAESRGPE